MYRTWYSKDAVAGLLFTLLGLFVVFESLKYRLGDAMHMGPGYFPLLLGGLLAVLGLFVLGRAFFLSSASVDAVALWPVVRILGAVVLFGLTIRPLGLVPAIILLVFLSRIGGHDFKFREVAVLAAILAATTAHIFVVGLAQPFDLWPT